MPVVTAFSVSEQITNAGAYAGLASILGLAVLSLLYFGQARELKRLRDWAGRAPERTAELQAEANQQAAAAVQRRPAAQAAGVPATPRSPAAAPATATSGSVRAVPATQAATAAGAAAASSGAGAAGSQAPPTSTPAPEKPAPGAPVPGTPASTPAPGSAPDAAPVTWAPSATRAGGNPADVGAGQDTQALPAAPAAPTDVPLPEAVPSVAASVPIGPDGPPTDDNPVPLRKGNAAAGAGLPRRRPTPEPVAPDPAQRSRGTDDPRGRRVGLLAGGAVVLLLIVVLATQVLGGGGGEPTKKASTPAGNTIVPPARSTTDTAPAVNPGDYAVLVLNGTTQNGIAAEVAGTLEKGGFRSAGAKNAAVNTVPVTEVFYVQGKKKGATAAARTLKVEAANVKPADANVTASASGQGADVIVQIGADKATP